MDGENNTTGFDLSVLGDASIDYFVHVPHIAHNDNKAIGPLAGVFGGGMSANLAASASASGARTQLITKIGHDDDAAKAMTELGVHGVHTADTIRDLDHRTWMCFVQLDDSGEKALTGADTGIKLPTIAELDELHWCGSRVVAPLADDLSWALSIACQAKQSGSRVAIDLEPDAFMPGDSMLKQLLSYSDIVFLNADAAHKVNAAGPAEAADTIQTFGPTLVVVSHGAKGASCFDCNGQHYRARSQATVKAVDTTGAGDALAGAFLGNLLGGADTRRSLECAVAQATACVTSIGSRNYLSKPKKAASRVNFLELYPVSSQRC